MNRDNGTYQQTNNRGTAAGTVDGKTGDWADVEKGEGDAGLQG